MTSYDILPNSTRVWIYQSNRAFSALEAEQMTAQIDQFADQWVSHNRALKAYGKLFHQQFVVLMVDESQAGASGCSIDSSVKFVKSLEGQYAVDFFDRLNFAYQDGETVKTDAKAEFAQLNHNGSINDETIVFDNLVKSKGDFDSAWRKRLGDSWHKRFV